MPVVPEIVITITLRGLGKRRKNHCTHEKGNWLKRKNNSLKTKRNRIENSVRLLHACADSLALQAEKENKIERLTNFNAFRKSAKDKEADRSASA